MQIELVMTKWLAMNDMYFRLINIMYIHRYTKIDVEIGLIWSESGYSKTQV